MANNLFSGNTNLKEKLKKQFEEEEKHPHGSGGNKPDPRFLNYWDLPENGRMKVLLLPDSNGDFTYQYETHGGGMPRNIRTGRVNCAYTSSGENCPACDVMFTAHNEGDTTTRNMWGRNLSIIAQCIVLESDVEISTVEDDDNLVKLFRMPVNIYKRMKTDIMEDLIGDPSNHELTIKLTRVGDNNNYEQSFFRQTEIELPAEIIEAYEAGMIRPYEFSELVGDVIPHPTTATEVQEWVEKTKSAIDSSNEGAPKPKAQANTGGDSDEKPAQAAKESTGDNAGGSLKDRLAAARRGG